MKKVTAKSLIVKKEILSDWFYYFNDKMLLGRLEKDVNNENEYKSNYRSYLSINFDRKEKRLDLRALSNPKKHKERYTLSDITESFYSKENVLMELERLVKNPTYKNVLVKDEGVSLFDLFDSWFSEKNTFKKALHDFNLVKYSDFLLYKENNLKKAEKEYKNGGDSKVKNITKEHFYNILKSNIECNSFNFASNLTRFNADIKELQATKKQNSLLECMFNSIINYSNKERVEKYKSFIDFCAPFLCCFQAEKMLREMFIEQNGGEFNYNLNKNFNFTEELFKRENCKDELRSFMIFFVKMTELFNKGKDSYNYFFIGRDKIDLENPLFGDFILFCNLNEKEVDSNVFEFNQELKEYIQENKEKPIDFKSLKNFLKFIYTFAVFKREIVKFEGFDSQVKDIEEMKNFANFIDEVFSSKFIQNFNSFNVEYFKNIQFLTTKEYSISESFVRWYGISSDKRDKTIFKQWLLEEKNKALLKNISLEKDKEKIIEPLLERLKKELKEKREIRGRNCYTNSGNLLLEENSVYQKCLIISDSETLQEFLRYGREIVELYNNKEYYEAEKLFLKMKRFYEKTAKENIVNKIIYETILNLEQPISLVKNFSVKIKRMVNDLFGEDSEGITRINKKIIKHIFPDLDVTQLMKCYLKIKGKGNIRTSINSYSIQDILNLFFLFENVKGLKEIVLDSFNYKDKWYEILKSINLVKKDGEWKVKWLEEFLTEENSYQYISHKIFKKENKKESLNNRKIFAFYNLFDNADGLIEEVSQYGFISKKHQNILCLVKNNKAKKDLFERYCLGKNEGKTKIAKSILDKVNRFFIDEEELKLELVKNKKYSVLDLINLNDGLYLNKNQTFLKDLIKQSYTEDKIKKIYSVDMAFEDFLKIKVKIDEKNVLQKTTDLKDKIEKMDFEYFSIVYEKTLKQFYKELLNTIFAEEYIFNKSLKKLKRKLMSIWTSYILEKEIDKEKFIKDIRRQINNRVWYLKIEYFLNKMESMRSRLFSECKNLKDKDKKLENRIKTLIFLNFMAKIHSLATGGAEHKYNKAFKIYSRFINEEKYLNKKDMIYRNSSECFNENLLDFSTVEDLAFDNEDLTSKMGFSKIEQMNQYYHRQLEMEAIRRNERRLNEMKTQLVKNPILKFLKDSFKNNCLLTKEDRKTLKNNKDLKEFKGFLQPLTLKEILEGNEILKDLLHKNTEINVEKLIKEQENILIYFPQSEKDLYLQGNAAHLCVHSNYKNNVLSGRYLLYYSYFLEDKNDIDKVKHFLREDDYATLYNKKERNLNGNLDHSTVGVVLNLNDNSVRFEQEKEVSNHYVKKDTLVDLRLLLVNYFNEILIEVNK